MIEALIFLLAFFVLLGAIRHWLPLAMSGLAQMVLVPIITILAYRDGNDWVAGFFTYWCVSLGVKVLAEINKELAKK